MHTSCVMREVYPLISHAISGIYSEWYTVLQSMLLNQAERNYHENLQPYLD